MIKRLLSKLMKAEEVQNGCQNAKKAAARYGQVITCPEDEQEEEIVIVDENCLHAKKVAGRYGYSVVCPEEVL